MKYSQHFRFIIPIISVLKELGGLGKPSEVSDKVIETVDLSEEELSETIKSGILKVVNQIHWAKLLLVKAGYMDSSTKNRLLNCRHGLKSAKASKVLSCDQTHQIRSIASTGVIKLSGGTSGCREAVSYM